MNFDWQVPLIVVALVGAILYFASRSKEDPSAESTVQRRIQRADPEAEPEPAAALSGPDFVDEIQRTLGIGILVDTVGSVEPVTIHATFMYGQYTTPVAVTGDTEAKAWEELARAAIAWRKSDHQNIPMWWGGAG